MSKLDLISPTQPFKCPYQPCLIDHEYNGTGACRPHALEHNLIPTRYKTQTPKEKKVYQIPKESVKQKELNKLDQKQNKKIRKERPDCEIKSPVCTGKSEGIHHPQGRKEGNLIDVASKLSSCNACNVWIEEHPLEAQKMGVAGSKHKTVKKVRDVLEQLNNK